MGSRRSLRRLLYGSVRLHSSMYEMGGSTGFASECSRTAIGWYRVTTTELVERLHFERMQHNPVLRRTPNGELRHHHELEESIDSGEVFKSKPSAEIFSDKELVIHLLRKLEEPGSPRIGLRQLIQTLSPAVLEDGEVRAELGALRERRGRRRGNEQREHAQAAFFGRSSGRTRARVGIPSGRR